MFEVEMLPAREGDCLWIRYGSAAKPRHILIDGGREATGKALRERLEKLPQLKFELLIVTHIDRDHIEGLLGVLEDKNLSKRFKDIWFNGYDHLVNVSVEKFSAVQGERLSTTLIDGKLPWNRGWDKKAVCLENKRLKRVALAGGMTLTLFSPDRAKLKKLAPKWADECRRAGLVPGLAAKPSGVKGFETLGGLDIEQLAARPFTADEGEPNGSSIAVLAEYGKQKVLLTGDAHVDRLIESIELFKKKAKRLKLDAFKVSHHASEHNISPDLLRLLDCKLYMVSTSGAYFKHPTAAAIARIIKFGGRNLSLFFNYRSKFTSSWDEVNLKNKYGYKVVFPSTADNGSLTISL